MSMDISTITLNEGSHGDPSEGCCLLEAVSMFAGESFGDRPECVCRVLAAFGRWWNDGLPNDEAREQLRQYIPRLVGTKATPAIESQRAMMAVDWMLRVYTPTWLDRLPALRMHAAALRAHPEIVDTAGLISVLPIAVAARKDAAAARAAARAAAGAAAEDAAWAAAWAAARAAARAAAEAAAEDAAWAAARAAARDAARAAARDAAMAAAMAAAWDAARAAARAALAPTVTELQASAHALFDRMIRVTE